MKRLIPAALILSTLCAEEAFLLPHRWQDALHTLDVMIRTADTPLFIVTDTLDDPSLRRTLHKVLNDGKNVTLITSSQESASQWAMYRSLRACVLPEAKPLTFSLLGTAERGCMLSGPLETEALRTRSGMMLCSDGKAFDETLRLLQQECKGYFGR